MNKQYRINKRKRNNIITSQRKDSGFTIVELLIVIVVIGILAAITIVAYSKIQVQARNATQNAAVNQYVKIIRMYKELNGSWPSGYGCLGENNIDTNGDGLLDCGDNSSTVVNAPLLTQLRTVSRLPDVVTKQIPGPSGTKRAGVWYDSSVPQIVWFVQGSPSECKIAGVSAGADGESVWCVLTLN